MPTKAKTTPAKRTPAKNKVAGVQKSDMDNAVQVVNPVMTMLQMAMTDSNVDLDKMEKIMQMAERHEEKLADKSFKAAMAELQGEMPEITKDGKILDKHGSVRSNYANYETIMKAIKDPLRNNGFAVSFRPEVKDNKLIVKCVVSHKDGHIESSTVELPMDSSGAKNNVQAIGSSMSYGKRYALCLMFNIPTGGEDTDGNTPEAPPRGLDLLTKLIGRANKIDELQMLWESFTSQEKVIAKDAVNVRKNEIK